MIFKIFPGLLLVSSFALADVHEYVFDNPQVNGTPTLAMTAAENYFKR